MNRKPKSSGRGGRRPIVSNETNASQGSAVSAESPLHLGFVPGTEGAGRIAGTKRSGDILSFNYSYHGFGFPNLLTQGTVARIKWVPMLTALSTNEEKGIVATAMFKYYNAIRSRNASISSFSPIDVFFALCGVSGLATLLSAIRKQLQILCTAGSQINGAFPETMMESHYLYAIDRDNLSSYIYKYNQIISLCKGLIMPKSFKMFARHARLAGSVFLDDPMVEKSQLIVLDPTYVWKWDVDPNSATVGKLIYTLVGNSITQRLSLALALVNLYTLDQDMNNIYAEIRKAFSDNEVYVLKEFPVDGEGISLEFEQVLLDSIKNAEFVGDLSATPVVAENTTTNTIYYSTDIGVAPIYSGTTGAFDSGSGSWITSSIQTKRLHYVYTHDNQPGEDAVADLLAFKVTLENRGNTCAVTMCGTELLQQAEIFYRASSGAISSWRYGAGNECKLTTAGLVQAYGSGSRAYSNFSALPPIDVIVRDASGTLLGGWTVEGDIDNRFAVTPEAVALVHMASFAYLVTM